MTAASKRIYEEFFPSLKSKRKEIVDSVFTSIQKKHINMSITPDELYLSLDEGITNAMEHGNKWDPEKKIHVSINITDSELIICISDEGEGFDTSVIPQKMKNRDILSTRGRGIFIIHQFCIPEWNSTGNQLYMKIPIRQE